MSYLFCVNETPTPTAIAIAAAKMIAPNMTWFRLRRSHLHRAGLVGSSIGGWTGTAGESAYLDIGDMKMGENPFSLTSG